MKRFNRRLALIAVLMAGLIALPGAAMAKTVTVGTGAGTAGAGDPVAVPITIDDPTGVGGVAFTLTYDAAALTFAGLEQVTKIISDGDEYWTGTEYDVTPEQAGNTLFYQYNDDAANNRVLIAGASAQALTDPSLFSAKFLVKAGAAPGTYPIGIARTIITNAAAGYTSPTYIPVLVGMPADTANDQGFYETPTYSATLIGGSITVSAAAGSQFTISGTVTYPDGGGPAADGTPVTLSKKVGDSYVLQAQTTVQGGAYSFASNLAGDYRVKATSKDPRYYDNFMDFNLSADKTDAHIVLQAPAYVSGTVTINNGYLPGLKVKIMNGTTVVGIFAVNADGTYQSGPLPPDGSYTAYAVYGSLVSGELTQGGTFDWDVTLQSISGTVSGLDGQTATVSATSSAGMITRTIATTGAYTIENLVPAADYVVSVVATGLPVLYYDATTDVTQAAAVDISSASQTGIDFNYTDVTKGTVSGTVAEGGTPAIGIGVYAFDVHTYALVSTASGADGAFELALAPGTYELFVIKSNGVLFYYDTGSTNNVTQREAKADLLVVEAGSTINLMTMDVLECDRTLTGKVTYERSDGNPVAYALIQAVSENGQAMAITGADGTYTLSGLCDGVDYTVKMDPQVGSYAIQTVTITAGVDAIQNFVIDTGWVLSGTVKDSVSSEGIPSAMIYLRDQETQALVGDRMYFSGDAGLYGIYDIPTGIYTLVASHPEYRTFSQSDVVVASDTSKDIPMVKGAHFKGTVLDGSNSNVPLGGVLIIVTRAGDTPVYAMTDALGQYAVYGLDAALSDYVVMAQKTGYERATASGLTPSLTGTQVDFTLSKPTALFNLSGMVTSDCVGSPPVPDALVVVSSVTQDFFSSTYTDAAGFYSFQDLPQAADYRIVVVPGGGLQVYEETGLSFTATATKNIVLPCGSSISGTVSWAGSAEAYVLVYKAVDNSFVDFVTLNPSPGNYVNYTFTGLTAGDYKVLAFADGNTPVWYNGQAGIDSANLVPAGATGITITLGE